MATILFLIWGNISKLFGNVHKYQLYISSIMDIGMSVIKLSMILIR